jgi:hypothetical protein
MAAHTFGQVDDHGPLDGRMIAGQGAGEVALHAHQQVFLGQDPHRFFLR